MGMLFHNEGQPAESLEWFDRAIRTLQPVHENEPRDPTAKEFLRNSHLNRALAHDQLQRFAEAIKDWDRAIELSPLAKQPECRAGRAASQLQAGLVVEAVAEVAELTKSSNWSADKWYGFACFNAVASKTDGINPPARQEYADRAMALLNRARAAGFKDAAHMKKDSELDPLREREDFKKLLAEMEKKSEKN